MLYFPTIQLGSKSPRRRQLLEDAGYKVELIDLDVEETWPDALPAFKVAPYLAKKKAAAAPPPPADKILICADTTVICDQTILNKAANADEATSFLRLLSGRSHDVVTGVCMRTHQTTKVFSERARVTFDPLTDAEIEYYIAKFMPYDKAGAYAIQEWIGLCRIAAIKGTNSNIMGLPMRRVYNEIGKLVLFND
jgi:septum formation protein